MKRTIAVLVLFSVGSTAELAVAKDSQAAAQNVESGPSIEEASQR